MFGNKLFSSTVREIILCYQKQEGLQFKWALSPLGPGSLRGSSPTLMPRVLSDTIGRSKHCLDSAFYLLFYKMAYLREAWIIQCKREHQSDYGVDGKHVDQICGCHYLSQGQQSAKCEHSDGGEGLGTDSS